ncbi:hypothetical protein P167DRAFT_245917 [Morchella conica CCBAS932]|uniref:Uncharacterized protein n=1 Tax=Morchella conica CCBAS932 TaxID=1392247 RepID=A0A3N4KJK8_9PEZI|nr:hypothetical protein P167DRAFT_245917 [Morchella conica CCBAS932]
MISHLPSICKQCRSAEESPEHNILHCPKYNTNRQGPLQTISSLDKICTDQSLTLALGAFITTIRVGYPKEITPSSLATGWTAMSTLTPLTTTTSTNPAHSSAGPILAIYAS